MSEKVEKVEKEISKEIFQGDFMELETSSDKDRGWKTLKLKGNLFMENLPDGITKSTVEKLEKYKSQYVNASLEAAADKATEYLLENKDVAGVNVVLPYGNNSLKYVSHSFNRCREGVANGNAFKTVTISTKIRDTITSESIVNDIKAKMNEKLLNK